LLLLLLMAWVAKDSGRGEDEARFDAWKPERKRVF
jgi:hypothetical protein